MVGSDLVVAPGAWGGANGHQNGSSGGGRRGRRWEGRLDRGWDWHSGVQAGRRGCRFTSKIGVSIGSCYKADGRRLLATDLELLEFQPPSVEWKLPGKRWNSLLLLMCLLLGRN